MWGRTVIFTLLFLIILSSPALASSEVKTYRDSEYTIQSDYFTDGSTVYILASNSITCCTEINAKISINDIEKTTIKLTDINNGFYKGSFTISSDVKDGSVQMANGESASIEVEFTPIYKRTSDISAYYIKPDSTEMDAELKDRVNLEWDEVSPEIGLLQYNIYRSISEFTDENKQLADIFTTKQTEYEDSTARDGQTYCYGISAVDLAGNIAPISNIGCIDLKDETAPSSVTGLVVSPIQGGDIKLRWQASEDNVEVQEYNIYKLKSLSDEIDLDDPDEATRELTYTDEKAKDGREYFYAIAAVDTSGNIGDPSQILSAVSDEDPPLETELTASSQKGGKIVLEWTEVAGADYYHVYASSTRNLDTDPIIITGEITTYTHFPQSETYYAIAAVDEAGNEAEISNIVKLAPDSSAPQAVSDLSAVANPDSSITLTWPASEDSDFKQYNIYRSTISTFDFSVPHKITTLNSFTDTELIHRQDYYYIVRAEDTAGNEDTNQRSVSDTARDLELKLEIVQPGFESKVSQDMMVVAGITDPDATMHISGVDEDVLIDKNGGFLTIIPLKTGEQEIIVRATDPNDNEKTEILKVNNRKDEISADVEETRQALLSKIQLLSETSPGTIPQLNIEPIEDILKEADPEVNIGELSGMSGLVTGSRGGTFSAVIGFIMVGGVIALLYVKKKNNF
jgi:LPXTG-motif cell wall-anchored protein